MAVTMNPENVQTAAPFVDLFEIDQHALASLTQAMKAAGTYVGDPIIAWRDAYGVKGQHILCDGHTRLGAAKLAGIKKIAVTLRWFDDLDHAMRETIGYQTQRRNSTKSQLAASVVLNLDRPTVQGQRNDLSGKSAHELAQLATCGVAVIEQLRSIRESGQEELLYEVRAGKLSADKAYKQARQRIRDEQAQPEPRPVEPEEVEEAQDEAQDGDGDDGLGIPGDDWSEETRQAGARLWSAMGGSYWYLGEAVGTMEHADAPDHPAEELDYKDLDELVDLAEEVHAAATAFIAAARKAD